MGGFGSGRRYSDTRKLTVEECLCLSTRTLRIAAMAVGKLGIIWWTDRCSDKKVDSLAYTVEQFDCATKSLRLQYRVNDTEDVWESVRLETTQPHWGGKRWWFRCPRCDRRVSKLYLRGRYFRCRNCHSLTYHSVQTGHSEERFLHGLAMIERRFERRLGLRD